MKQAQIRARNREARIRAIKKRHVNAPAAPAAAPPAPAAKKRVAKPKPKRVAKPNYDAIPKKFPGERAVVMATGPSLCEKDIEYIRPFHEAGIIRVFGCNDAYRICPFIDVLYGCDPKWWDCNQDAAKHSAQKWTQDARAAKKYGLSLLFGSPGKGLCDTPGKLHWGSNSGYQVINLAYHYGITSMILLGYNMDVPKGMKQHFFGIHAKPLNQKNSYKGFAGHYKTIQANVKANIVNCTYPTHLDAFVQTPLEAALPRNLLNGPERQPAGTSDEQASPEDATLPEGYGEADLGRDDGRPDSDGPEPVEVTIGLRPESA